MSVREAASPQKARQPLIETLQSHQRFRASLRQRNVKWHYLPASHTVHAKQLKLHHGFRGPLLNPLS
ncbi:hypothetical protein SRHO_G00297320 [Serrasalmus rhombeus]